MFCSKCGAKSADGVKFCGSCGNPFSNANPVEEKAPVAPVYAPVEPVAPVYNPPVMEQPVEPVYNPPVEPVAPVYNPPVVEQPVAPVYNPPVTPAPAPQKPKGNKAVIIIVILAIVVALLGTAVALFATGVIDLDGFTQETTTESRKEKKKNNENKTENSEDKDSEGENSEGENSEDENSQNENIDINNIEVGSYIKFGSYEQDNNVRNGKEDIEWLVLAKEDNRILVVSRYALDSKTYHTKEENVTWETCAIRQWLNGEFINNAFSTTEQAMIPTVTVSDGKNPVHNTHPGNSTRDKVFLLSIGEVSRYFATDTERLCAPTDYAIAQGAWTNPDISIGGRNSGWWLLRSPGLDQDNVALIHSSGAIREGGEHVDCEEGSIRPAMWITLE